MKISHTSITTLITLAILFIVSTTYFSDAGIGVIYTLFMTIPTSLLCSSIFD